MSFILLSKKLCKKKKKNYVERKTVMNLSKLTTVFVLIILIYLLNLLELFCIEWSFPKSKESLTNSMRTKINNNL